MSRRNSIILGMLFVILVVEIIILAPKEIGTLDDSPAKIVTAADQEKTGQIMKDVYSIEAKKEGKEWELWASRALQPNANQEWTIERVKVKFYAMGGVLYTVTGREGRVSPNQSGIRDIKVTGNVVTHSSNGYIFKSESVFYDSQNKRLSSSEKVEMLAPPDKDGGGMELTGTDMLADMATNEITVNKNVKAAKRLKGGKHLQISSDRAVFSGHTKMAQFLGNVAVNYETMTLTGPEAKFAYDKKGETLESVQVAGGIRVTDTDKFAVSQSVNVNFLNDQVVFKGSPRVTQNGDQLTGDEIVFLDGGHKVQVKNARAQIEPDSFESNPRQGSKSEKDE